MFVNLEELKAKITKIVENHGNQALVSELSAQLIEELSEFVNTHENVTKLLQEKETEIQNLQKTNMNLFLKVAKPIETEKLQTGEELTYDDLIKDMEGMI